MIPPYVIYPLQVAADAELLDLVLRQIHTSSKTPSKEVLDSYAKEHDMVILQARCEGEKAPVALQIIENMEYFSFTGCFRPLMMMRRSDNQHFEISWPKLTPSPTDYSGEMHLFQMNIFRPTALDPSLLQTLEAIQNNGRVHFCAIFIKQCEDRYMAFRAQLDASESPVHIVGVTLYMLCS